MDVYFLIELNHKLNTFYYLCQQAMVSKVKEKIQKGNTNMKKLYCVSLKTKNPCLNKNPNDALKQNTFSDQYIKN